MRMEDKSVIGKHSAAVFRYIVAYLKPYIVIPKTKGQKKVPATKFSCDVKWEESIFF